MGTAGKVSGEVWVGRGGVGAAAASLGIQEGERKNVFPHTRSTYPVDSTSMEFSPLLPLFRSLPSPSQYKIDTTSQPT